MKVNGDTTSILKPYVRLKSYIYFHCMQNSLVVYGRHKIKFGMTIFILAELSL